MGKRTQRRFNYCYFLLLNVVSSSHTATTRPNPNILILLHRGGRDAGGSPVGHQSVPGLRREQGPVGEEGAPGRDPAGGRLLQHRGPAALRPQGLPLLLRPHRRYLQVGPSSNTMRCYVNKPRWESTPRTVVEIKIK